MIERIRSIIVRFPENEEAVRELIRDDRDFDALCQEYADIGKEIEDLAKLRVRTWQFKPRDYDSGVWRSRKSC